MAFHTQRYNRLRKTDGPLFRGRYKAILVDKDAYLLQLSRYIHRNPIEVKGSKIRRKEYMKVYKLVAIYCCQQIGDAALAEIAKGFGLGHAGSISRLIYDVKVNLGNKDIRVKVGKIKKYLSVIQ